MTLAPPFANDLPYCAWAAKRLHDERARSFPAQIAAGKLTQNAADHSLAIARAIVAQWRWAIDPQHPPLPASFGATEADMVEQLRKAAAWERTRFDRAPDDRELRERTLIAEALLWHQEATGGWPRLHQYIAIAHRNPAQRFIPDEEDAWIYHGFGLSLEPMEHAA